MKIGLFTDGLAHLSFSDALAKCAALGVQTVEIGTGNFSPAPHCDLEGLLSSAPVRKEFLAAIASHGLTLAALNCSGNPIHPNPAIACKAAEVTRKTLQLAGLLGVQTIVCMTGCPGTPGGDGYPNWVVASWPEDFLELLDWQWRERVIRSGATWPRSLSPMVCAGSASNCTPACARTMSPPSSACEALWAQSSTLTSIQVTFSSREWIPSR